MDFNKEIEEMLPCFKVSDKIKEEIKLQEKILKYYEAIASFERRRNRAVEWGENDRVDTINRCIKRLYKAVIRMHNQAEGAALYTLIDF